MSAADVLAFFTQSRTDSHFYITRPGVLWREVWTIGGNVLVLGGSGTFVFTG